MMTEQAVVQENETQESAVLVNKPKANKSFKREALIFNFVCMLIPVLHWLVFWLYVNAQSISMAFIDPLTGEFDFLTNYKYLWATEIDVNLSSDYSTLLYAGRNTMIFFAVNILITLPMSVIIAYFIYKKIVGYKFFRIVFYLPAVLPAIVLTTVYTQITNNNGLIDTLFHCVPDEGLLFNNNSALGAVIVFVVLCGFTTNVLLFSGGMARVPIEVIEAAKLDGCGPMQEIIFLIIPLIWPTLTTQIILAFTNMFNNGSQVTILTQGHFGTTTLSHWLFFKLAGGDGRTAVIADGIGAYYVSAVGLVLTLIAVPIILLVRKLFEKVEPVEY